MNKPLLKKVIIITLATLVVGVGAFKGAPKAYHMLRKNSCWSANTANRSQMWANFQYGMHMADQKVAYNPADDTCYGYYFFTNETNRVQLQLKTIIDLFAKRDENNGTFKVLNVWTNDPKGCKQFAECLETKDFDAKVKKLF